MDSSPPPDPLPSSAPEENLPTQKFSPSVMQGLLAAGAQTQSAHHWQPPSVEALQRALPQYEISAFIARGGMGAVYKGEQKALKRPVAIKVLPPEADSGDLQFAERFKREAQAMARLSHPNIVAVHDAGQTADGLLYFVMEYVEGTDVAQLITSEGRIGTRQAAQIITAVCEALAFAHEEGIIHRDIKPSNIMIDRKGRVKVADFGLAKTVNVESTMITRSDMAMGTPDFVAPEALIPGITIDQRADLYAVGVMLYQMLTGKIPRGRFDSPSQVVPRMDKSFDAIVDKAMQTDRDKRYSTATEMKRDVEKVAAKVMKGGREDTLARAKKASANGSADTLVRPSSPGGGAAKHPEAGKSARAPLLIAAAAVVLLGGGAWLMMGKAQKKDPSAAPIAASGSTAKPASFFPLPMNQRPTQAGQVVMWRLDGQPVDPNDPEAKLPPGLEDVVMLASRTGDYNNGKTEAERVGDVLALKADGTVVGWGGNSNGTSKVPAGLHDIVSIVHCGDMACTLNAQGRVLAWGKPQAADTLPHLAEKVVSISGQGGSTVALTETGKIIVFGGSVGNERGKVPDQLQGRAIAAVVSGTYSPWLFALRNDGTPFAWGEKADPKNSKLGPLPGGPLKWPDGPSNGRVPVQPGQVPRLMPYMSLGRVYVEGYESAPITVVSELPGYATGNSKLIAKGKVDLKGLERLEVNEGATALKLPGHWRFEQIRGNPSASYNEQMAEGCIALAFTDHHAFGIKPGAKLAGETKPTTSPKPTPPAITAAPAPAGKVIKLWDTPQKITINPGKIEWRDGAVFLSESSVSLADAGGRDVAFRSTVKLNADSKFPNISVRRTKRENLTTPVYSYKLVVLPGNKSLRLAYSEGGNVAGRWVYTDHGLQDWKLDESAAAQEWLRLELRAKGPNLTVSANGKVLGTIQDTRLPGPGGIEIIGNANSYFKDIEYEVLDGAATAASANAPEVWRDRIAEKRATGLTGSSYWEDNGAYLRPREDILEQWAKEFAARDGAVRATWSRAAGGDGIVQLRRTYAPHGSFQGAYTATFNGTNIFLDLRTSDNPLQAQQLARWPLPSGVDLEKEHMIELRAVGDQLTVLFDGQPAGSVRDGTLPGPGGFGIWAKKGTTVRCIEYRALEDSKAATPPTKPAASFFPLPMPQRPTQAGQVVMWRLDGQPVDPNDPEAKLPPGLDDVVQIAADGGNATPGKEYATYVVALKADGTVVGWGNHPKRAQIIPPGVKDVVSIVASGGLAAALGADGRVVAWGNVTDPLPPLNERVVQISGQKFQMLALTETGRVIPFGYGLKTKDGQVISKFVTPPELQGRAVSAVASADWLCGIRDDGALFAWGAPPHDLEAPITPSRLQLPWDQATNRLNVAPGQVPRLFVHGYLTDIIVAGHEEKPIRLADRLPDYLKKVNSLYDHKLDLRGLERIETTGNATALKIGNQWRFDTVRSSNGNIRYS